MLNEMISAPKKSFLDLLESYLPNFTSEEIGKALESVDIDITNSMIPNEKNVKIEEVEVSEKKEKRGLKDSIEIELPEASSSDIPTWRKYNLIPFPASEREFFPGYKSPFTFKTDIGNIKSWVTGGSKEDDVGDPYAGKYISKGMTRFYRNHPELKPEDILKITKLDEKTFRLEIKP